MIIKKILSYIALSSLLFTSNAHSVEIPDTDSDVMDFIYSLNVNEIPDEELNNIKEILDSEGTIEFKDVTTGSLVPIFPGSMPAEDGLRFIPDEEPYVDTYVSLIEHGALPFAAVMLVYDEFQSASDSSRENQHQGK